MIELYMDKSNDDSYKHCITISTVEGGDLSEQIGRLFIESIRDALIKNPKAVGNLIFMIVNTFIDGRRSGTMASRGSLICCGDASVIKRKNFIIGADEDGTYTSKTSARGGDKIRKLELDDIADIDVDKSEKDDEVPF